MSGDNVIYLHRFTHQALPVARVLDAAQVCEDVLVLGVLPTGELYCAASTGDVQALVFWLETLKHRLLAGEFA